MVNRIISSVLMSLLIVVSVVSNSTVLFAIIRSPSQRVQPTNFFVVNLVVVDLIASIVVMPLSVSTFLATGVDDPSSTAFDATDFGARNGSNAAVGLPTGRGSCAGGDRGACVFLAVRVVSSFVVFASVLSVTVASVERFYSIRFPMRHSVELTIGRTLAVLCCVWLLSTTVALVPALLDWSALQTYPGGSACVLRACSKTQFPVPLRIASTAEAIFVVVVAFSVFVVPAVVMATTYCGIYRVARRTASQVCPSTEFVSSAAAGIRSAAPSRIGFGLSLPQTGNQKSVDAIQDSDVGRTNKATAMRERDGTDEIEREKPDGAVFLDPSTANTDTGLPTCFTRPSTSRRVSTNSRTVAYGTADSMDDIVVQDIRSVSDGSRDTAGTGSKNCDAAEAVGTTVVWTVDAEVIGRGGTIGDGCLTGSSLILVGSSSSETDDRSDNAAGSSRCCSGSCRDILTPVAVDLRTVDQSPSTTPRKQQKQEQPRRPSEVQDERLFTPVAPLPPLQQEAACRSECIIRITCDADSSSFTDFRRSPVEAAPRVVQPSRPHRSGTGVDHRWKRTTGVHEAAVNNNDPTNTDINQTALSESTVGKQSIPEKGIRGKTGVDPRWKEITKFSDRIGRRPFRRASLDPRWKESRPRGATGFDGIAEEPTSTASDLKRHSTASRASFCLGSFNRSSSSTTSGTASRPGRVDPRWKAAATLLVILVTFVPLWTPFFAVNVYRAVRWLTASSTSLSATDDDNGGGGFTPDDSSVFICDDTGLIVVWVGFATFATNSFVYGWMNRSIRDEVMDVFRSLSCSADDRSSRCCGCCCRQRRGTQDVDGPGDAEDFFQFLERTSGGRAQSISLQSTTLPTGKTDNNRSSW